MTWSGVRVRRASGGGRGRGGSGAARRWHAAAWRGLPRVRRATALVGVPSLVASGLMPAAGVVAGAVAVTAVSAVVAAVPARASLSGSVLVLSTSVNGGSSSTEAQQASGLGLTVTVATPSTWDAMTQAQFAAYNAIIIGDPSTSSSCSTAVPPDALSTDATWGAAVSGNVAVLGTAPALGGATTLIKDAIAYAASGGGGKTGLYVSLNCEYPAASADTAVPLLDGVLGGGFAVTGQGPNCPSDAGTVNTWQALALASFNGLGSSDLGPWSSPACSVQETFTAWPAALGGLAYLAGASPASFTASDGARGQPYILAGAPASAQTAALAPSAGGEVPAGAATGGSNPAAPGVSQATAGDPVNTESGDFAESATDLSVPTFGPSLDFSRTYDAQLAQAQTQAGTPGPMGYGWTENWASSLSAGSAARPVPGDVYTLDGMRTAGLGRPPTSVALQSPAVLLLKGSDTYIADPGGNRVLEIPGTTGTQWGVSMTAGDEYVIAGSPAGVAGSAADGTAATSTLLDGPQGLAMDSAGDLYIADSLNNRVEEIAASSGTQWGISMTAGDAYRVAGRQGGGSGHSGDGTAATSAWLDLPVGVSFGHGTGDLYIADSGNSRIQEVPAENGGQWGISSMTAYDVYTVAGDAAGACGTAGNGVAAASAASLCEPEAISFSSAGDMYIADTFNNRIVEVPAASGGQWGFSSMTAHDLYTVAGSVTGAAGSSGNGGPATSAKLSGPDMVEADNGTQLYIADAGNSQIREAARSGHTEWGQNMAANDIYLIAGTTTGWGGDGGAATSAKLSGPAGLALDGSFNLYIADTGNSRMREVSASTYQISTVAGNSWITADAGNFGPAAVASLSTPNQVAADPAGNIYIADAANNRVQEIAASTHTQWGVAMTAGDVYTIAGNAHAIGGYSGDSGPAVSAKLRGPDAVAFDAAGNLYISDTGNNVIREVAASGHTQWNNIAMTANDIYTIAGTGAAGFSNDGGLATTAQLAEPRGLAADSSGDLFIADYANNMIREIAASAGTQYGVAMSANHIYRIAGSATALSGDTGDGGPGTSALLWNPAGVAVDGSGDVYIADTSNSRVQELAAVSGWHWHRDMTAGDIYTIAGQPLDQPGSAGDGGQSKSSYLNAPYGVTLDAAGNLYIADTSNNRIQEIAAGSGAQWGQQMSRGYIYTVAGSATGSPGRAGDGGPAASALLNQPDSVAADPSGNLYLTDSLDNRVREVVSATGTPFPVTPAPGSTVNGTVIPGGIAITQDNGSQVTFYPVGNGCIAPYTAVPSGQYCTLPQNVAANLSYGGGTYTYTPSPGESYTYNTAGQLTSETSPAGDTLAITYGTPLPGSGNCPSAANWCELITSASGRALTIGYNAASLITSVTDPMGRTWSYGYTSSDLTSVSDPMSPANVTTYTYGASTTNNPLNANNLLTITRPNAQPGGPDAGDSTVNVYDTSGRVTSQTDPMGWQTTFAYAVDPSTGTGTTTTTDPDGNTTVDAYSQGTLTAESKWTGGTILTSEQDYVPAQTASGNSPGTQLDLTTTDGNGNVTAMLYNGAGYATSVTQPDGVGSQSATTTRSITALENISCDMQPDASSTCQQSPGPSPVAPGGVITPPSSAPPQGGTWTLYDTYGNALYTTTGVYQPGSQAASYSQTTYQLFRNNAITLGGNLISCNTPPPSPTLPCATIDENGVVTQLAYNGQGDLTSSSTPDGNANNEMATTTYVYDGDGEQTSTTSPDGNLSGANSGDYTTISAYNNDGQKTSVTEGGGTGHSVTPRITNYGYDGNGNQTSIQDARGYTTVTTYNADDESTLVTDPDGNATLTCYDGAGNTTQTVPPAGVAANSLTPASCPASYPAAYGTRLTSDSTTYSYNQAGNRTAMTTPAPAGQTGYETTTYSYDRNGNMLTTTAPPTSNNGPDQITVDTYNSTGEIATQTTAYGTAAVATTSYCYDPNGHVTSVVPGDGNASTVASCEASSPWIVSPSIYPNQAKYQTTYAYDSAGELVSSTTPATSAAPSGETATWAYSAAGDLQARTDPNGITTTWTYSPLRQIGSVVYSDNLTHSVSYSYDANGNTTSMTDATGSSSYVYNSFNEVTSVQTGSGLISDYGYDADGQVAQITYPLPSTASWALSSVVGYTYDHADLLTKVTDFNGNQVTMGNNADGLPDSVGLGSGGDTVATTYDNADGASEIALKSGTTVLQSFTYLYSPGGSILNEADMPTSSQTPAAYTYDASGRVTTMELGNNSTVSYGFDSSSNLTGMPNGATGSYDDAGELTSSTPSGSSTSYTYDADGERLTAKQGASTIATGSWNGAGQLTSYSDVAASMTAATYDGYGMRASATTGGTTEAFTWDASSQMARLLMDSRNAYIYAGGNEPVEQVDLSTGAVTYLVEDALGSVRGTVSSSGTLTGTTGYDAWGNPAVPGGLTAATPFGYAGGYTDATGLIYLVNRYYDPNTGQFISVDPAVAATMQPYQYAGGDPVNSSDPSGLWRDLIGLHQWGKAVGEDEGCVSIVVLQYCSYFHAITYSNWISSWDRVTNINKKQLQILRAGSVWELAKAACHPTVRLVFKTKGTVMLRYYHTYQDKCYAPNRARHISVLGQCLYGSCSRYGGPTLDYDSVMEAEIWGVNNRTGKLTQFGWAGVVLPKYGSGCTNQCQG